MFAAIKNLIPEPRRPDQPRHYTGRHRKPEPIPPAAPVSPAPTSSSPAPTSSPAEPETSAAA